MIQGKYLSSRDDISAVLETRRLVFSAIKPEWAGRDSYDDMALYAVAILSGSCAGSARLSIQDDVFTVSRVCVLEEHRGKGLGDLMIRMLLVRALDMGANEIRVYPLEKARPFYARFGFKEVMPGVMSATRESIDRAGGCSGKCCKAE